MIRILGSASLALLLLGCGSSGSTAAPAHTAEEEAAIRSAKAMTPEQQIEQIEKGPLPESQKATLIQSIKTKNGIP